MDRGKTGSRMHVLSDANGLPLRVGVCAANTHDSLALKPMPSHFHMGHESHATESKPRRLHAGKAHDVPHPQRWLWGKRIGVRLARKAIESSERLGRRRWVIERTMSWLTGYHRINHQHEHHPGNYLALLRLAATICCYKHFRTDYRGITPPPDLRSTTRRSRQPQVRPGDRQPPRVGSDVADPILQSTYATNLRPQSSDLPVCQLSFRPPRNPRRTPTRYPKDKAPSHGHMTSKAAGISTSDLAQCPI